MKGSKLQIILLLGCTLGAAGGLYLAYDFHSRGRDRFSDIDAEVLAHQPPEPINWAEQGNATEKLEFSDVALVPQEHHEAPVTDTGDGGGHNSVTKPDLTAIVDGVESELTSQLSVVNIYLHQDGVTPAMATFSISGNLKNLYPGDSLVAQAGDPSPVHKVLGEKDIVIVEIQSNQVTLSVTTPELTRALEEWTETGEMPHEPRLVDGHVRVVLKMESPSRSKYQKALDSHSITPLQTPLTFVGAGLPGSFRRGSGTLWKVPSRAAKPPARQQRTVRQEDQSVLVGDEDLGNGAFDPFVNHVSTYIGRDGRPAGIKIGAKFPEDHRLARAFGAKRGDIIKSINGQKVTDINAARAAVLKQRNAGTTAFNVVYRRNGVEQTKTFHVPPEK